MKQSPRSNGTQDIDKTDVASSLPVHWGLDGFPMLKDFFFFFLFFFLDLFIYFTEGERVRSQVGGEAGSQQAPREPNMGLNPRTLGS